MANLNVGNQTRREYAQGVLAELNKLVNCEASDRKSPVAAVVIVDQGASGRTFNVIPHLPIENVKDGFVDQPPGPQMFSIRNVEHDYVATGNGFLHAILAAYNGHHALILTPDDVWLSIMTQFSFFMGKFGDDAEIRDRFVSFKDKKELVVRTSGELATANWHQLCQSMSNQLVKYVKDPFVREWIVPNFSTTTPTHKIAGLITLFSTLKHFFNYTLVFMCGIPQFTLQGTIADWEDIQRRFDRFLEFDCPDLHKWHATLAPVLRQFTEAAKGNIDVHFWQCICKCTPIGSGGQQELTGWAAGFNFFDASGKSREGSVLLTSEIASGVCSVPIHIDDNGVPGDYKLVAGHSSYAIVNKNTLQPNVEWSLTQTQTQQS